MVSRTEANVLRVAAGVAIATLIAAGVVVGVGSSASAEASAEVIDIAPGVRAHPRNVSLIGPSSVGVLYASEQDPTSLSFGDLAGHLHKTDGTDSAIDGISDRMVGDREVEYAPDSDIGDLQSRVLPDLTWVDTDIPDGWNYLGYTASGVLVNKVYTDTVEQVPWGGGTPVVVTGLPAAGGVEDVGSSDSAGILLGVEREGSKGDTPYYVDGATGRAVHVGVTWSSTLALGNEELAWLAKSGGKTVIDTMARPTLAHPTSTIHRRPAPAGIQFETVLPVGKTVVVFHGNEYGFQDFTAATHAPVIAVSYAGKSRTLLAWGHDVMVDGTAGILAVGGSKPVKESIDEIDPSTGAERTVVTIPVVESHAKDVAIDGDSLYSTDDTAESGSVVQHELTFGDAPTPGAANVIDTGVDISPDIGCGGAVDFGVCSSIETGDGTTVWGDTAGDTKVRSSDGTISSSPVDASIGAVSGNWALADGGTEIANLSNGQTHSLANGGEIALDDGAAYLTGSEVSQPATDIVARDLATDADTVLSGDASDCKSIGSLNTAGNWLVMSCLKDDNSFVWRVVDQTGATPAWEFPDDNFYLWVGDGFMARVLNNTTLQWAPLAASSANWTTLGTVADSGGAVSVGRGSTPTIAWIDDSRQVRAALLPVTPASTGELTTVNARWNATTSSIDVSWTWAASNPASFTVEAGGISATTQTVDGDVRSASIPLDSFTAGTSVSLTAAASPTRWTVTALRPDSVAPTPSLSSLDAMTDTSAFSVTPDATDNIGVLSVDVRERSGAWDKALGAWTQPAKYQGIDNGTLLGVTAIAGSTYCFSSRARDAAGNVSGWSKAQCTNVLLPATSLHRTGAWKAVSDTSGYRLVALQSSDHSDHLTATTRGHYVAVRVYEGPSAGTLDVNYGNTHLVESLKSSIAAYGLIVIPVPSQLTKISISPGHDSKAIIVSGIVETAY